MHTLIATLGFTPRLTLKPLDDFDINVAHIIYGDTGDERAAQALSEAKQMLKHAGIQFVLHGTQNPWDYRALLRKIQVAHELSTNPLLNASGGTRVMVMASTIYAFTHDIRLLYYDDHGSGVPVEIPVAAIRGMRDLGETQQRIMDACRETAMDMQTLAHRVGVAASTLSVHVAKLERLGLVEITRDKKRKLVQVRA